VTHQQKNFVLHLVPTLILLLVLAACGSSGQPGDIKPVKDLPAPTAISAADGAPAETDSSAPETTSEPPAPTEETAPVDSVSPVEPPAVAANFTISGGVVGFCDTLTVTTGGEYNLESCKRDRTTGTLEAADLKILQNWLANFTTFQLSFEDNPGGVDSLKTTLNFSGLGTTEPDESQKQMAVEWFNGLFIRLWPQVVEAPPTPTPTEIGADGLCPNVARPALIIADFQNPGNLTVVDPNTLAKCNVALEQTPSGRIMTAAGNIYYPVFDPATETMTVWKLSATGEQTPLEFTRISMAGAGPFTFIVSEDGAKIAWARTGINPDVAPPIFRNDLWAANSDGSDQVVLIEQSENSQRQFVVPIRFSPDGSELFYAVQPDGQGSDFSGRFGSVYSVPVTGGAGQLIFVCPSAENPICVGDISPDGNTLAYIDRANGEVRVVSRDGTQLAAVPAPLTEFVGSALFGPTGNLAFVAAVFEQQSEDMPPLPAPGIISLVTPPYTGQPQTLLSDNSVVTLWEWLDETRLAYGSLDTVGNLGTSIVTIEGQAGEISPNYALAVLR